MRNRGVAPPDQRPPASTGGGDDVAELRRRQAAGEIASDLDSALVQLAMMGAILAPISMPQVARRLTGLDPSDPEVETTYTAQLKRIIRHLAI